MRARGFTLVEVMVALAIVAIALPAVLMALYRQVDDTAYLRDKTMAAMVAANTLAEMRLVIASTRTLAAGKDNGMVTMADRDWHWWLETTQTEQVPQYYRIEIKVSLSEDPRVQPLYTLTAFMQGDLEVDTQGFGGDGGGGEKTGGGDADGAADDGAGTETGVNENVEAQPQPQQTPIELPTEQNPDGQ